MKKPYQRLCQWESTSARLGFPIGTSPEFQEVANIEY
jgi:hypothetical protein